MESARENIPGLFFCSALKGGNMKRAARGCKAGVIINKSRVFPFFRETHSAECDIIIRTKQNGFFLWLKNGHKQKKTQCKTENTIKKARQGRNAVHEYERSQRMQDRQKAQ